jgi:iron complex outermembrane receptor protein
MEHARNVSYAYSAAAAVAALFTYHSVQAAAPPAPSDASSTSQTVKTDNTEGSLDEVVVSAQRREERLQDVPISITNISTQQLTDAGITDLGSIMKLAPDIRFDAQGSFVQATIRGVGSSVVTTGSGSNVGIYIDGFFVPNPQAVDEQLLNIDSIQVLKGPQGTLFGRNTTAGAILVNTTNPSQTTNVTADVSYGSFNTQREQAYVTAGLTDKIAVDAAGMYTKSDSYFTNIATGNDKEGAYANWMARTGMKFDLTDRISFLLRYEHQNFNDPTQEEQNVYVVNGQPITLQAIIPGAIVATQPGQVANPSPNPALFKAKNDILQLTSSFDLGLADLTSYSQFRHEQTVFGLNGIAGSLALETEAVPVKDDTITQEFLLTSKPGPRLQYTAGLYYFHYTDIFRANVSIGGAPLMPVTGSGTYNESYAAYADATYQLLDKLYLTAGLRYTHDEVSDGYYIVAFTTERVYAPTLAENKATPRVVVRYAPDQNSSIYASFSQGYKAGIYNLGGDSLVPVKPENINAYEIGYKYARQAVAFDLASFYYNYKDLQVPSYGLGPGNVPLGFVSNAATARIYGFEGDVRYEIVRDFEVNASAAYLNAKYTSFPDAPGNAPCFTSPTACGANFGMSPSTTVNASGFEMQRAPRYTGSLGAKYSVEVARGRLALSSSLYDTARFYEDSAHETYQPSYATLGLRGEWTDASGRYTLAVYGDNVTGKRYYLQAYPQNSGYVATWSAPAMVFGEIRVRFH